MDSVHCRIVPSPQASLRSASAPRAQSFGIASLRSAHPPPGISFFFMLCRLDAIARSLVLKGAASKPFHDWTKDIFLELKKGITNIKIFGVKLLLLDLKKYLKLTLASKNVWIE